MSKFVWVKTGNEQQRIAINVDNILYIEPDSRQGYSRVYFSGNEKVWIKYGQESAIIKEGQDAEVC